MIISDRGSQFVAHFWEQPHASLGTHLIHSSAYHPQMDGQTERVDQILEDMLRACVLKHQGSWVKNLPWAEFSYNNSYQGSLKMAPFEVLYVVNAALHSIGLSMERRLSLDLTFLKKLKQHSIVSKIT
jgi:transposase InsO family protein